MSDKTTVVTGDVVLSYPTLFKARKNELSGKDEFGGELLFPAGYDFTTLKQACFTAAAKKWGPDPAKWPQNMRTPFRMQDEKAKNGVLPPEYTAGCVWMRVKSDTQPGVVTTRRLPDGSLEPATADKVYAGVVVKACLNAYAYSNKGNNGVSFGLQHIQITGQGKPISNRVRPQDAFESVADPAMSMTGSASDLFGAPPPAAPPTGIPVPPQAPQQPAANQFAPPTAPPGPAKSPFA